MEPTIPAAQWGPGRVCLQKNQMGCDWLVTVKFQTGNDAVVGVPCGMKMLPESKPSESGSQDGKNRTSTSVEDVKGKAAVSS